MKKYLNYGGILALIIYILYPYVLTYIMYIGGNDDVVYKPENAWLVALSILSISIVIHLILSFIISNKDEISLYKKLKGYVLGFFMGTVCSIALLIICSYCKTIYNIIIINYIHKANVSVNHHWDYFYTNAYIPFCVKERYSLDIKMFFMLLLYSVFNLITVHIFTRIKLPR